jgi:hypothetical protein
MGKYLVADMEYQLNLCYNTIEPSDRDIGRYQVRLFVAAQFGQRRVQAAQIERMRATNNTGE